MNEYQFGGRVGDLQDEPTAVVFCPNAFGSFRSACDEGWSHHVKAAILPAFGEFAASNPSAANVCANATAFLPQIEAAINHALAAQNLPPLQLLTFNVSLSEETRAELEAATAAKRAAAPVAGTSGAPLAIAAGAAVLVQWSDGNRYPGIVHAVGDGHFQIGFPNGQVQWIPTQFVARA